MSAPKVSVIIPVYNVQNYLKGCLKSVMNQTLTEIEIICVDDGSTDSSGQLLDQFAKIDKRIIVIHRENGGLSIARNTGIEAARGEYLGFVDSDDFIDEEMYEKLYASAKKHDSDVVVTNLHLYLDDTRQILSYRDIVRLYQLERESAFAAIEQPDIVKFIGVWDKLYRRSFIEKYHLRNPEKRIYEDALFTFQTLVLASRISVVSEPLYYYRKNTGSAITDKEKVNDNYKRDFLLNSKEIRAFLTQHGLYTAFSKAYLEYQFEFALFHQSNIASKPYFFSYFKDMRDMLLDSDYEQIKKSGVTRHIWYAEHLKNDEPNECYKVLRRKRIPIHEL
jgi:glycosyltransferase involved in cell wall biosynthesis